MWTAYSVARSGAQAQEHVLDVAANNLANTQTNGFKARRAHLVDLTPGASTFSLPTLGNGIELVNERVGQGAGWDQPLLDQTPGPLQATGRSLDVAIAGDGFFQVALPSGGSAYTREGSLHVDANRRLVTGSGLAISPEVQIPEGVGSLSIRPDGAVFGELGSQQVTLGRIDLVHFSNPSGLKSLGGNLFGQTSASGSPTAVDPARDGLGSLTPGALEASNVDVGDELVKMLQAQRAYQVNLRALRTVDEMVQEANALGR